jgi:hypothetical protein
MSDTVLLGADHKRVLAMLAPDERCIAESLLNVSPNYRYELSGLPRLDPPPAPGAESAAAAAKAMMAWVRSRRFD